MKNQRKKKHTEAELMEQAIKLLWDKNQYEDAIALTKRLLRLKPRHPLYYMILSDCYKGISIRDNDIKASEKSRMYWDRAFAFDGKFVRSDYWQQGIEAAARYLLVTQDLEKLREIETEKLEELSTKQVTTRELYDTLLGQVSVSEDPKARLAVITRDLMLAKAGFNQELYAFDSEDNVITPTLQEFIEIKRQYPKRQIIFAVSYKDPLTGEETRHAFNILKNFSLDPPSESVIKARRRRKRYYDNEIHKKERREYQKIYDSKNRQRKRVRNKLDYSWRKSGLTKKQAFPRENSDIPESL